MNLGKNLRYIREARQISRHALADALNLSYSSICKYESGLRTPDYDTLAKMANVFQVSMESLFTPHFKKEVRGYPALTLPSNTVCESSDPYDADVETGKKVKAGANAGTEAGKKVKAGANAEAGKKVKAGEKVKAGVNAEADEKVKAGANAKADEKVEAEAGQEKQGEITGLNDEELYLITLYRGLDSRRKSAVRDLLEPLAAPEIWWIQTAKRRKRKRS